MGTEAEEVGTKNKPELSHGGDAHAGVTRSTLHAGRGEDTCGISVVGSARSAAFCNTSYRDTESRYSPAPS